MNLTTKTQNLLKGMLLGGLLAVSGASAETVEKPEAKTKQTKSFATQPNLVKPEKGVQHLGKIEKSQKKSTDAQSVVKDAKANAQHHVWIYSVDVTMTDDFNHNGYFSRLIVDFDVDTAYDHSEIYAVMTLTDPIGYATDYFVTSDFDIYGESTSDDYRVNTVLTGNWPADGYDLSIHIYDSYSHELLAYVDKHDAPQLSYLTLESLDYEYSEPQYMSVFAANLLLLQDSDNDGFYHEFQIELDVDVSYGARDVYAEIYISDDNYNWQHLYTSSAYHLDGDSAQDKQTWFFELLSGHPTDHHFIKVLIIDEYSHNTLLEVMPETNGAFYNVPLEDVGFEVTSTTNPPPVVDNGGSRSTASTESGGSFGGLGMMMALGLLAFIRRKK